MSAPAILIERRNKVALVTMNRPEALNALSIALRRAFGETMLSLANDDTVGAVVLTGAGERAFSAGLDLKELGRAEGLVVQAMGEDPLSNPIEALRVLSKPVVAAINGVAITGGFEVALACDILIASDAARFADTHGKVGVLPGWGLSQRLPRIIGAGRAKELAFTGKFIDANTAFQWGIVNDVVRPQDLVEAAVELGSQIASSGQAYAGAYRRLIDDGLDLSLSDGLALEQDRARAFNALVPATKIDESGRSLLVDRP